MMNEKPEYANKNRFLTLAAEIAETTTDELIIIRLKDAIERYDKAQICDVPVKELNAIFMEISIISYINVLRMIDKKAADIIKDIEKIERVFDLINPNKN